MNKKILSKSVRSLRIIAGIISSVLIAEFAGVEFAPSTAIITLLGIQSTRKETLKTAMHRIASFIFTIIIAYLFHLAAGTGLLAFFLTAVVLIVFGIFIGWDSTISINLVIAVHLFLNGEAFTPALLINEALRIFIGITVALLVNAGIPTREQEFISCKNDIERRISEILKTLAGLMRGSTVREDAENQLTELKSRLNAGRQLEQEYKMNDLTYRSDYYLRYLTMRESEISIIDQLIDKTVLSGTGAGCCEIADYMEYTAACVAIDSPVAENRRRLEQLKNRLEQLPLPTGRNEFNRQSALFTAADNLFDMVQVKETFIESLSDLQKRKYWQ